MADLKGCPKGMKDKVVDRGKEAHGKAIDDKSREAEGKAQSLGSDIKEKVHGLDGEIKSKFSRKDENK